jgi:hypothetical protein
MQAQILQTMQQTVINLHAQHQASPSLRDMLGDFQRTKPPTFSHANPINSRTSLVPPQSTPFDFLPDRRELESDLN